MRHNAPSEWKTWFQPNILLPAVAAGIVSSIILVVVAISFGAMIFSGNLAPYIPRATGFILFGVLVISSITALTSTFPSMVSSPQDNPAAILAAIASSLALGGVGSREQLAATLIVTIMLASILTGLACFLLGRFKLGEWVRYIPYPVVGGFLAGVGYLLLQGSLGVLADENVNLAQLQQFFQPALLIRWLPGVIFGLALLLIVRRVSHFLVIPAMIVGGILLFYVVLFLTQTSIDQALQQKLLLGDFPAGGLWQPPDTALLAQVNWPALLEQLPKIATVVVISIFSLLLNLSGLEVVAKSDFDLNHELKTTGIANIVGGLGGSAPGYPALSLSVLGYRMKAESRLVGLTVAVIAGITLFVGASALAFLPKYILGGLLFFLGLSFLVEWLYDGWFQLRKVDYFIVLSITVVTGAIGVLEGVAVGMICTILAFIVDYSRIDIVKHEISGAYYRSNVERTLLQNQLLSKKGDWIHILELQGFIFFAVANRILTRVGTRVAAAPALRYLVLDFRRVTGIDTSAVISFVKLKQIAQSHQFVLIFTHLSNPVHKALQKAVFTQEDSAFWQVFPDLDHGLEWGEEQVLKTFEEVGLVGRTARTSSTGQYLLPAEKEKSFWAKAIQQELRASMPDLDTTLIDKLSTYFERKTFDKDSVVIQEGTSSGCVYFLETGQVAVQRKNIEQGGRLRLMGAGTVIGEISFYTNLPATASIVTTQPSTFQLMTADTLKKIEHDDPQLAIILHRFLAHVLSTHLIRSTAVIENLSQ